MRGVIIVKDGRPTRKPKGRKNIICPSCKRENGEEFNFCANCGKKLKDTCKCWVLKKDNYSCKERSCPGYKLLTKLRK